MKPHGFHAPGEGFCEIGAASNFSFLRGASKPEEMVVSAKLLGLGGLGLADRNTLSGVVRAYAQARSDAMAFRPGARLVFSDGTPEIFAYPRNREGWGNLCRLLSLGNLRTVKGDCRLALPDLLERGSGLNLALLPDDALGQTGPEADETERQARDVLQALFAAFGRSVRLALAFRYDGLDERRLVRASHLAAACRTPLLATNDAFFHSPERQRMQDVVTAIREHVQVGQAGLLLSRNAERRLKSSAEMARLFRRHPGAVEEAGRFFRELGFDLKSLRYEYPDEGLALGEAPVERLRRLAQQGAATRYPGGVPETVFRQIETELAIIEKKGYEPYFLTVYRIVEAARGMGILCQGRGSAANSVVCFAIGVTEVDPGRAGLLFDRFISEERDEPPDIDIDFEHERRDDVIRWIYETYGHQSAAIAATVISYRSRSSLREVGKAFGLSEDALSALSGTVWGTSHETPGEREARAAGLSTADPVIAQVLRFAGDLSGFPRHLSQHVGGFVLTRGRIDELVPVLNTGSKGRTIVEWDKDDLDELGILKVDVLALGMLSCLRRAFEFLKLHYPDALPRLSEDKATMALIADDDRETYEMTHRADTLGVFQIESRAQMTMLPKLKPREFYDLVIQVAIVRPGPIQGDMVHPYLRRRMGLEDPVYPKPELEEILKRTCGVPLFQEQAMRIAMVAAKFTGVEADKLRRAMATFKRTGEVHNFKDRFIAGMKNNGYEEDFADRCFKQIEGFGEYGFPESHAASFALIVYASCWLKCHYPDVFCASLLNAQPMGFYAPAQIVRDAREHGIEVRPVAINSSRWDSTLEEAPPFDPRAIVPRHRAMAKAIKSNRAVRLGFRQVKGLSEHEIRRAVWVRDTSGPFDSVRDLWLRSGLHRDAIERLADADAFAEIGLSRREALWACRALDAGSAAEHLPLFASAGRRDLQREPDAGLPPMPLGEEVINDYRFLSLSLKAHPVSFVRAELGGQRILPNAGLETLRSGARVCVSGLVLVRQRPGSAKGVIFMTIEDETGVANVIVWPKVFERFRPIVLGARFVKVTGRMQSDHGVIHVVSERIEDLTHLLMQVAAGDAFAGAIAPADHVRHPLRPGHPRRQAPAALPADAALGTMLAHADEVRRPIDETRRSGQYRDRIRRLAIEASRVDAVQQPPRNEPDLCAVLPRGRNFQ